MNGVHGATSSHVTEEPVDGGGARLLPAPRVSPGLAVGAPADGEAVPAMVPPPSDLKHDPESEELEEGGGDGKLRLAHGQGLADLQLGRHGERVEPRGAEVVVVATKVGLVPGAGGTAGICPDGPAGGGDGEEAVHRGEDGPAEHVEQTLEVGKGLAGGLTDLVIVGAAHPSAAGDEQRARVGQHGVGPAEEPQHRQRLVGSEAPERALDVDLDLAAPRVVETDTD
jgi:hypothetical protein